MNVLEDKDAGDEVEKLVLKQKLDNLLIADGKDWQSRFKLPEQIPVTLVVANGRVRIMHDSVMADPVSFLEADLKALQAQP